MIMKVSKHASSRIEIINLNVSAGNSNDLIHMKETCPRVLFSHLNTIKPISFNKYFLRKKAGKFKETS